MRPAAFCPVFPSNELISFTSDLFWAWLFFNHTQKMTCVLWYRYFIPITCSNNIVCTVHIQWMCFYLHICTFTLCYSLFVVSFNHCSNSYEWACLCVYTSLSVFLCMDFVFLRPQTVILYHPCVVLSTFVCVCNCRVGGGGKGVGLRRPRVISRDQASLMSARSSRGTQASHAALPTPGSPSLGTFWLHTAPCWKSWPQHHIKYLSHNLHISFAKASSLTVCY